MLDRRLVTAIVVAALVALPAFTLRVLCVGKSCTGEDDAAAEVPFCSLQAAVREPIGAGFREGRSPEVLGVAPPSGIEGGSRTAAGVPWPGSDAGSNVPLVFSGAGVAPSVIPPGASLDDVAPTIARIIGFNRPHPEVRSGAALEGVASGEAPRLVLEIVLVGIGSDEIAAGRWPNLEDLLRDGAGTLDATAGSSPTDPAAVMTTIGTGGLPSQHGITGSLVRDDDGRLVGAWGPRSPLSIIATLGDDLDEKLSQEPRIGLVAANALSRGLVGGEWYVEVDEDDVTYPPSPKQAARSLTRTLERGYGTDDTTDLLAYSLEGSASGLDLRIGEAVDAALEASDGSLAVVVVGTGSKIADTRLDGRDVAAALERALAAPDVVEASVPGGVFLNQGVLVERQLTEDEVLKEMRELQDPSGVRMFADVFPAIAVSFKRYC